MKIKIIFDLCILNLILQFLFGLEILHDHTGKIYGSFPAKDDLLDSLK